MHKAQANPTFDLRGFMSCRCCSVFVALKSVDSRHHCSDIVSAPRLLLKQLKSKSRRKLKRMAKDRSWMYGSIDSSNYIDGVLEFCKFPLEHQERIGSTGLYCPCVKCVNVEMVDNVDLMREHILRRGFRPQYHVWIWHGESGIYEGSSDVPQEELSPHDDVAYDKHHGGAYYDEDEDGDMNCVDEMMQGLEEELGKDSRVFETISEAS